MLGVDEGLVYEVIVDGKPLEHVSKFNCTGLVLDELGEDGKWEESYRCNQISSEW